MSKSKDIISNLSGIDWSKAFKSKDTISNLSGIDWSKAFKSKDTISNLSGIDWSKAFKSKDTISNLAGIDWSDFNKDVSRVISSINAGNMIEPVNYFQDVKPSLEKIENQKLIEQIDKLEKELDTQNRKRHNQKKQSRIQHNKIDQLEKKLGKMYPFADNGRAWVNRY